MSRDIFKDQMNISKIHCEYEIRNGEKLCLGKAYFNTLHTGMYFHCTAQVREFGCVAARQWNIPSPPMH